MDTPNPNGAAHEKNNSAGSQKPDGVERVVYAIVLTVMAVVPLLAFLFSFGNVGDLGTHLGVDQRIAYLTGPGVDLTATGMIVAATWLSYRGRTERELMRIHILSVICALMMFGLNCGPAIYTRHFQLAAFNAVGPFLLMAMGFVGPWLLRQLAEARQRQTEHAAAPAAPEPAAAAPAPRPATAVAAPAPAVLAAAEPAAAANGSVSGSITGGRKTTTGTGGNGSRKKTDDAGKTNPWAELALPLWQEYTARHGEPPTAPVLGSLLRRAHPDKKIPGSERSERIICAATRELAKHDSADDEAEAAGERVAS